MPSTYLIFNKSLLNDKKVNAEWIPTTANSTYLFVQKTDVDDNVEIGSLKI